MSRVGRERTPAGLRRGRALVRGSGVTLMGILIAILILGLVILWLSRTTAEPPPPLPPPEVDVEVKVDNRAAHLEMISDLEVEARDLERRIQVAVDDLNARGESWEVDVEEVDGLFYDLEREVEMAIARGERENIDVLDEERKAQQRRLSRLRALALELETGDVDAGDAIALVRSRARGNSY